MTINVIAWYGARLTAVALICGAVHGVRAQSNDIPPALPPASAPTLLDPIDDEASRAYQKKYPLTAPSPSYNEPPVHSPPESTHLTVRPSLADSTAPQGGVVRVDAPGQLGLYFHALASRELEMYGVNERGGVVTGVFPGTPAAAAGILPGDVIVEVNGQATPTASDVMGLIGKRFAGDEVTLLSSRRGARSRLTVRLSPAPKNSNPETFKLAAAGKPWAQYEIGRLYFSGSGTKQDFKKARHWYQKAADAGISAAQSSLASMYILGQGGDADFTRARELHQRAAELGLADSQYMLAWLCLRGQGGPASNEEGARWFQEAAQQGHAESQFQLARMAAQGQGLPKDEQVSIGLLTSAAEAGHKEAMGDLGHAYAAGTGVPINYAEAIRWLTPAAEGGVALAQHDLGALYYYGKGVERNFGRAAKWFEAAANQGLSASQVALGELYLSTDPPNPEKSRYWREKAAGAGDAHALASVGHMYSQANNPPKDKKKALDYYVKAATGGYWPARVDVAILIVEGIAVRRDDAKAIKWLEPVVNREPEPHDTTQPKIIANAHFVMGTIYHLGANNVPKDLSKAFYWYGRAARGGQLDSQRIYGQMLRDRKQHAEAVTWLREAATRGDRAAQNDLGMMYLNGWGVAKSEEDAIAWLLRAYQQGSPTAKNTLSKLGVKTN